MSEGVEPCQEGDADVPWGMREVVVGAGARRETCGVKVERPQRREDERP
jgi:hypothetical protein